MSTEAIKGKTALDNGDFSAAITHLTAALKSSQSPLWLIQRSTAYHRFRQYDLALADADNAVLAAIGRGKRELIATAHLRRAVALHGLGRFGDARLCLHWSHKFNEKEKGLTIWVAKVKQDYENAGGEDAECNQITVKEVPDKVEEISKETKPLDKKGNQSPNDKAKGRAVETPNVKPVAASSQTPKEKIRHEWYQSPTTVTIEILAKGVPKATTNVEIQAGSVSVPISHRIINSNLL
jgi:suppressor of G2 allele of SKP1